MFVGIYYVLRFEKELQIQIFLKIFLIFELKIRVFDKVYAYLILQFAVIFPGSLLKNFILIAFVYQKLLHGENSKIRSKSENFNYFPILR